LIGWAFLDSHNLNFSNRPVRTRTPGGVAGVSPITGTPYADCPSKAAAQFRLARVARSRSRATSPTPILSGFVLTCTGGS
jgi:hypothetical protein